MDLRNIIKFSTVQEYIDYFPETAAKRLEEIRSLVKKLVPEAQEVISYNMPAFKYHGILIYFAAHTEHIGFYPAKAEIITALADELRDYATSKGTIQLPMNKKIPIALLTKIIKLRAAQNLMKVQSKKRNGG
jgi:uncharacterized protein YdhG (YjbR/CyaY superfamily)